MQAACECGHVNVLMYLLEECNASPTALCPYCDPFPPEFERSHPGWEPMPNPAPPLFIAAASDRIEAARFLLERGADVNAAAYNAFQCSVLQRPFI